MTFSVVGRSAEGAALGVAVASKFLAVGAAVPAAEAGVGAIATQSYANLAYRPDGLAMLREGRGAQETLDTLVAADDGREQRQAGIVDAQGHVQRRLESPGYSSLDDRAGVENFEERMVQGSIDPLVLAQLRDSTS